MAPKKTAKPSSAIVRWDDKFAKYAKEGVEQVKSVGTGGVGLKFGRGTITLGGVTVPEGRFEGILIGSCALNAWYASDYDPNDVQPPDCYAFALITDDPEMAPHEKAPDPQAQLCAECDKNVFGTAKVGRGKACANTIRLGIITARDAEDADGIATAELATAKISPTNLKNYAGYVKAIAEEYGRPVWSVVTEISSHDDPKTQIRVEFKFVALIDDDDVLNALERRFAKVQDVLQAPFAAPTERPVKAAPVRGNSQKFAPKKQITRR